MTTGGQVASPNRRTPEHLKLLKGTYRKDRAAKAVDPAWLALPEPPRRIPAAERRIWRELSRQAPHLRVPDQFMFEILVCLMHQFRTDRKMQSARISLMLKILGDMWLTPATRQNIPPAPELEGWDEF